MKIRKNVLDSQQGLKILEENENSILVKAGFGPSKETIVPFILSEELAFFVGAIIGDGHLTKNKNRISIELSDKGLIKYVKKICKNIFNRDFSILLVKRREGRMQTYVININSKAIYSLLNNVYSLHCLHN